MDWCNDCRISILDCQPGNSGKETLMKNRLKVYRAMHDLTQEQLANKLEVTRATINAIENQRYDPSLRLAFQIARFFNVQIEELFLDDSIESNL
jgi:putative transcriptional regulator